WTSDKAYIDMMVKDHEKDLAEFKEEANSGSDPHVKKFADDTAKVIQEHLDLAKETQGKLKYAGRRRGPLLRRVISSFCSHRRSMGYGGQVFCPPVGIYEIGAHGVTRPAMG